MPVYVPASVSYSTKKVVVVCCAIAVHFFACALPVCMHVCVRVGTLHQIGSGMGALHYLRAAPLCAELPGVHSAVGKAN